MLKLHARCPSCDLVLEKNDAGDGPVFFGILFVGFAVMTLAGIVEYQFMPPLWLHAALWLPAIIGGTILTLRVSKAYLIGLEYRLEQLRGQEKTKE
jgi:uncharacterized protein (DUF983 family)